mgnify:FL=1
MKNSILTIKKEKQLFFPLERFSLTCLKVGMKNCINMCEGKISQDYNFIVMCYVRKYSRERERERTSKCVM